MQFLSLSVPLVLSLERRVSGFSASARWEVSLWLPQKCLNYQIDPIGGVEGRSPQRKMGPVVPPRRGIYAPAGARMPRARTAGAPCADCATPPQCGCGTPSGSQGGQPKWHYTACACSACCAWIMVRVLISTSTTSYIRVRVRVKVRVTATLTVTVTITVTVIVLLKR